MRHSKRDQGMGLPPGMAVVDRAVSFTSSIPSANDMTDNNMVKVNEDGSIIASAPYKYQIIQRELDKAAADNSDHNNVIAKLCEMGIKCYLVMHDSADIYDDLYQVVEAASNDDPKATENMRCCLYKDERGRVFNIEISGGAEGFAGSWKATNVLFSGFEATAALLVLCRSFACTPSNEDSGLRPAYLSLVLGLVLSEEISNSWINVAIFVRGIPSVGAHLLRGSFTTDWQRKLAIFSLAMAAAAIGTKVQKYLTLFGVLWSCNILAVNLGARAWKNVNLKPLAYSGFGASIIAWVMATFAGICFPYLGFNEVVMGGRVALQNILVSALFVAIVFLISDIDKVQQFLLVGSEACEQHALNIAAGGWYIFSLLASIWFYTSINTSYHGDGDSETFLVENQSSPVGYSVPRIPTYHLDPSMGIKPISFCKDIHLKVLGSIIAIVLGGFMIVFGLFYDQLQNFACKTSSWC